MHEEGKTILTSRNVYVDCCTLKCIMINTSGFLQVRYLSHSQAMHQTRMQQVLDNSYGDSEAMNGAKSPKAWTAPDFGGTVDEKVTSNRHGCY